MRFRSPVTYAKEKYDEQALDHPVLPAALDPAYQGEDHANHIRKMQSSFSWDWGPAFPTVGLWFGPVSSLYLISIRTKIAGC